LKGYENKVNIFVSKLNPLDRAMDHVLVVLAIDHLG